MGIATQQGKILLRDGSIGVGEDCCCGEEECVCPPCDDNFKFTVEWGGLTAETTFCFEGGYSGAELDFSDGFKALGVSAGCDEGNWTLSAELCILVDGCSLAVRYEAFIECKDVDSDGRPFAGAVTLQEVQRFEDPPGCSGIGGPTSATITK